MHTIMTYSAGNHTAAVTTSAF